ELGDLVAGERDLETDGFGGIEQAIDVTFELEHAPFVRADSLEHAVTIQQAVIEDADDRFFSRSERSARENHTFHDVLLRVPALTAVAVRHGLEWTDSVHDQSVERHDHASQDRLEQEPIRDWILSSLAIGSDRLPANPPALSAPRRSVRA